MFEEFDMHIEVDPDTGLPALPRGQFWRVKKGGFGSRLLVLELRQKVFIGSYLLEDKVAYPTLMPSAEATVRYLADRILDARVKRKVEDADFDRMLGDYPPKKLGGKK